MTREQKRKVSTVIRYTLLILVGFIMVYPLIWMVGATFKTNSEILQAHGSSLRIRYLTDTQTRSRATAEKSTCLSPC